MGVVTNLLILISVLSALPWLRNNFHNIFERHHRFIGWFVDFLHSNCHIVPYKWLTGLA